MCVWGGARGSKVLSGTEDVLKKGNHRGDGGGSGGGGGGGGGRHRLGGATVVSQIKYSCPHS